MRCSKRKYDKRFEFTGYKAKVALFLISRLYDLLYVLNLIVLQGLSCILYYTFKRMGKDLALSVQVGFRVQG